MNREQNFRTESAVSPVVGVLLMLVVTIIIAAVVSGFAGGLAGDTKAAPSAAIDVQIKLAVDDSMGGLIDKMSFEMLSGDAIPTKDLEIRTAFKNSTGYVYTTIHTQADELFDMGYGSETRLPYLNDVVKVGYAQQPAAHFGNYTWSTGDILSVQGADQIGEFLGMEWTPSAGWPAPPTIDEPDFKPGEVVEVTITHTPSQKLIYSKEVIIQ